MTRTPPPDEWNKFKALHNIVMWQIAILKVFTGQCRLVVLSNPFRHLEVFAKTVKPGCCCHYRRCEWPSVLQLWKRFAQILTFKLQDMLSPQTIQIFYDSLTVVLTYIQVYFSRRERIHTMKVHYGITCSVQAYICIAVFST